MGDKRTKSKGVLSYKKKKRSKNTLSKKVSKKRRSSKKKRTIEKQRKGPSDVPQTGPKKSAVASPTRSFPTARSQ